MAGLAGRRHGGNSGVSSKAVPAPASPFWPVCFRETDDDLGSDSFAALEFDPPLHRFNDSERDHEPEAGAFRFVRKIRLAKPCKFGGLHAFAVVLDMDDDFMLLGVSPNQDLSFLPQRFNAVFDDIDKGLLEFRRIPLNI